MGTIIHLALGRLEVDWGKNSFFKNHGSLFQLNDQKKIPCYYAGEDWPDGEPIIEMKEGFSKPLGDVIDRLELLGHTLPAVERHYRDLHKFHGLSEQPIPFERLRQALAEVDVNLVSGNYGEDEDYDPGEFVQREIIERLELTSELNHSGSRPDHWEIDLLLENFNPYGGLRLLAENPANHLLEVNWDFSALVDSGWARREEFKPGPSPEQCFLVVTEGSSDAKIIQHAIKLLRPHISDFFRFVDMEEGYPFTGTGNLYRFAQGLISIGIQNNTVIIYDNDAEGVAKLRATKQLSLPPNVRAMQLPSLRAFSEFKTEGPTGFSYSDINGKAAAIECYLDLTRPGLPEPIVHWSSYNKEAGVYQGEIKHKTQYMKHFLSLKPPLDNYETEKMEEILNALVKECVKMAEEKLMKAGIE